MNIPLSIPHLQGNEWKYIKECLDTNWVSSVGSYVNRFEEIVSDYTGIKHAIACSSGTAALHIALLLAGVQPADLVLIPNLTFVATANAVQYTQASPILIDIEEQSWQLDLTLLLKFLEKECRIISGQCIHRASQKRIAAIMPVHILGNLGDMATLIDLANEWHLAIVEDATEALGSFYKGKHAGSFGVLSALSFNGNKIITTGGGGMILTNNTELATQAKHLTTQAKASSSEYYHDRVGYNYRLSNILAAMGVAQMEQFEEYRKRKQQFAKAYREAFQIIKQIRVQTIQKEVQPNHWLNTLYVPDKAQLLKHLKKNHIQARPLWQPMNRLPMYKDCLYVHKADISNDLYEHCVSIPSSIGMSSEQQQYVIETILRFYK